MTKTVTVRFRGYAEGFDPAWKINNVERERERDYTYPALRLIQVEMCDGFFGD